MGQINLVRAALPFIADKGSFTLISGVLTDEYTAGGVIGTVINHIVEGFVKAAAVELPRGVRINCISPTVLTESVAYHPYFPGFIPVDAWEVGQAYLRFRTRLPGAFSSCTRRIANMATQRTF
jgi:NAD(P)-dependent dehydrogenase (short-subunit alcohol dehydrogenase family)